MLLLDTDVMVDVLRRYPPAVEWLASLGEEPVSLPGLVALELLQGCRNLAEQKQVETVLRQYALYWPDRDDGARAFDDFVAYHLSHNLGLLDALIAETVVGLGGQLATFNTKHYSIISTLQAFQPYARS